MYWKLATLEDYCIVYTIIFFNIIGLFLVITNILHSQPVHTVWIESSILYLRL